MDELIKAITAQTEAVGALVDALDSYTASNAALLEALMADGEEQSPSTDLEGNPIRGLT